MECKILADKALAVLSSCGIHHLQEKGLQRFNVLRSCQAGSLFDSKTLKYLAASKNLVNLDRRQLRYMSGCVRPFGDEAFALQLNNRLSNDR